MNTRKKLREFSANLEKWRNTCANYEIAHKNEELQILENHHLKTEYHRGAKEAFDRALDRLRQLFAEEMMKP